MKEGAVDAVVMLLQILPPLQVPQEPPQLSLPQYTPLVPPHCGLHPERICTLTISAAVNARS